METKFISYKELAKQVGCSSQTIRKVHAKKIIELFEIDTSRLPKAGVLPIDCCNQYFNVSNKIQKKSH